MFNNPFDSFHSTVAEAKEEREQLDRLLTISTQRERLLVAVIGLLLLALLAWLFFGDVGRSLALDGVLVESGEDEAEGNGTLQALVWVESDAAPLIKVGVRAAIELGSAGGEADTLDGEVAAFSAVPLSEGLAALESAAPVSAYRVDIALDKGVDVASLAGRKCRIVLELGGQAPVAYLHMRRS
ncbi:MAG: hypothetical protein OXM01_03430 [Gemmatimonadota bacterium]|nr:hypothetical protein [Gemmatimonadota bacterium]